MRKAVLKQLLDLKLGLRISHLEENSISASHEISQMKEQIQDLTEYNEIRQTEEITNIPPENAQQSTSNTNNSFYEQRINYRKLQSNEKLSLPEKIGEKRKSPDKIIITKVFQGKSKEKSFNKSKTPDKIPLPLPHHNSARNNNTHTNNGRTSTSKTPDRKNNNKSALGETNKKTFLANKSNEHSREKDRNSKIKEENKLYQNSSNKKLDFKQQIKDKPIKKIVISNKKIQTLNNEKDLTQPSLTKYLNKLIDSKMKESISSKEQNLSTIKELESHNYKSPFATEEETEKYDKNVEEKQKSISIMNKEIFVKNDYNDDFLSKENNDLYKLPSFSSNNILTFLRTSLPLPDQKSIEAEEVLDDAIKTVEEFLNEFDLTKLAFVSKKYFKSSIKLLVKRLKEGIKNQATIINQLNQVFKHNYHLFRNIKVKFISKSNLHYQKTL